MKEEWKYIKENPNYMVSNLGRVKSLGRWIDTKCKGKRWKEEKILKPKIDKNGYQRVGLYKNGVQKWYLVHRLVYEAFYGEIPNGMQVNHINEIKTDNRLENLNLMTPKENINWGSRNERVAEKNKGKHHTEEAKNKISEANSKPVLQIDKNTNEVIEEFPSTIEVERQLGFANTHISACCNGGYFCKGRNKWVNISQAHGFKWKYKE